MTKQSFQLDPDAQFLTDNDVVGKVNDATVDITRAGSVDATARPIEANEVTNAKLATTAAKDNLDAMADVDRGFVKTNPLTGEYPIIAIQREADGDFDVEYDDQPIS